MKLFVIVATFSGLVARSTAQDQADIGNLRRLGGGRGGGRGGGGGKYGGGKDGGGKYGGGKGDGGTDGGGKHGGGNKGGIFSMMKGNCYWGAGDSQPLLTRLQEECDVLSGANPSYCAEVAGLDCARDGWKTMDDDDGTSALFAGCTEDMTDEQTEAMMSIAEAKKETWMEMTDADRAAYIEEKQGFRADNKALVLGCGCCVNENDVTPASALIKDREGAVAMTLGFRMPREDGEGGGHGFGGGGHHGGGGDLAAKLTEMIATECTDDFVAAECDDGTMDCTFEKPETSNVVAIFEDPESVAVGLDGDKASQLKREFQVKKERCHQNMLKCACCAEMTVEEILAAKEAAKGDHEGSRPSGGAWSGRPEGMGEVGGGMFGENSSSGDESSGDESSGDEPSGDESQSQGVSDGDSSELGGDVSQPQGGSEGDSSGPEDGDRDIDAALEGKCSSFTAKGACQSMEAKNGGSMNCSNFDSTKMIRGRKKKYMLYCGCCL